MIALALIGVTTATMADFNLAAQPSPIHFARFTSLTSRQPNSAFRYSPPHWEEAASNNDGIRVKLKWKRVRLTVPFGGN